MSEKGDIEWLHRSSAWIPLDIFWEIILMKWFFKEFNAWPPMFNLFYNVPVKAEVAQLKCTKIISSN